ncbi:MAG: cytochrome c maturation protein CcmE [Gemmatimonadota bacterium]
MRKDRRFFVGLIGVAAVVIYLVWTGIAATMTYAVTPAELFANLELNPEDSGRGIRVSGHVLPGSHSQASGELKHQFIVVDPTDESIRIVVEFPHPLPDTFSDDQAMLTEVVMEGRLREDGIFEATEVLTKCGSRYEAVPEAPGSEVPSAGSPGALPDQRIASTEGKVDG